MLIVSVMLVMLLVNSRLLVVEFWGVKSYMQIFKCAAEVGAPNPCVVRGWTIYAFYLSTPLVMNIYLHCNFSSYHKMSKNILTRFLMGLNETFSGLLFHSSHGHLLSLQPCLSYLPRVLLLSSYLKTTLLGYCFSPQLVSFIAYIKKLKCFILFSFSLTHWNLSFTRADTLSCMLSTYVA